MKIKKILFSILFLFFQVYVFAQSRPIKGTVKDASSNETIPGVIVLVEGTTTATATDIYGAFSIIIDGEEKNLVVSGVGYTKKIVAADKDVIDISLSSDVTNLKEMVVTANAIPREKRRLGYSTTQLKSSDLTQGQNSSPLAALQGKVSGVNITSGTGAPGSATRVVIRGGSSFTGENQPLIVVDGVPIDNASFRSGDNYFNQVDYGNRGNDINPDDIESVTILKGPGAAALYGSRASNGAILYTTKSGKTKKAGANKKMEITLNSNTTFSRVLKLPELQNEFGQGNIYGGIADDRRENSSWGLPFDGKERPWGQIIDGKQQNKKYEAIPSNVKDYFNTGITYNNTLGIAGGNEKSTYYMSLNALKNTGIIPNRDSKKYNIRFNGSTELTNSFSSTYSANYTNQEMQLSSGGQNDGSLIVNLIQTPRDVSIIDGKDLNNPFNTYDNAAGKYGFYGAYALNPYFVNKNFNNASKVDRIQGNVSLRYHNEKYKWISILDRLGGDVYTERHEQKWKKYNYTPYDPFYAGANQTYQGKYSQDNFNVNEITNDLMINLNHEFNEDFKINGLFGHNYRQRTHTQIKAETNAEGGLAIADFYNLENSNGPVASYSRQSQKRLIGVYMDANAAYKNMLFLGVTARNDWSSTLPASKRAFFYPSTNASFVFSELFKEELKAKYISYGKLRVSWAQVGNDASPYLEKTTLVKGKLSGASYSSTTLPFTDIKGNVINGYSLDNTLGNANIRPEITTAFEVGLEMNFLQDRVGFDAAYYDQSSKDQIIRMPLPSSSGYLAKVNNAGVIRNHGIELMVRGTPILTENWKFDLIATYTKNFSQVVSLAEGVDQLPLGGLAGISVVATPGKPYGTFYGRDYLRDPQGRVVVNAATGLPIINPTSVYFGTYNPNFYASIRGNITYKNFTFGILFDGKKGGQFFSSTRGIMGSLGTSLESIEGGREPRVLENSVVLVNGQYIPNTKAYSPYELYTGAGTRAESSELTDASYVKLREVSLSFRLPGKWFDKTPLGGIAVGVFGNNLILWTPKENKYTDPEINAAGNGNLQGFEFASIPSQRNFGFNIKVNF
ncbi:MAG: SusC/RagA family TonB-linked outer membrane protein [Bacteroidia bacterium]